MGWEDYEGPASAGGPGVAGTVKVLPGLRSTELGNRRDILAYLPPSYETADESYPVIYMHDGQNLFDPATSFAGEWHVDGVMEDASRRGLEAIVVGIPNAGDRRLDEYSPWVDPEKGGGRGDAYLRFIVETVKPEVDAAFRTLSARGYTGIAGSSMGGLISLYALFRHPETFGFAGALSPALWFAGGAIFPFVESTDHAPGRVYLDVGTREGVETLRDARRMRDLLRAKGYTAPWELQYVEETGAGHSEAAWARRLPRALPFLLGLVGGP